MLHRIHSHKSEEPLLGRSLAIDAARGATRTSSVRVKSQGQPSSSYADRLKAKAGHHYISNRNIPISADCGSSAGTPSRSNSRARKPLTLFDDFGIHSRKNLAKACIPSITPPRVDIIGDNVTRSVWPSPLSGGAERLPGKQHAAKPAQERKKRLEKEESDTTDAEGDIWYECDQSTSQREEEEPWAVQEYHMRAWWEMIRLALQVDSDSNEKCSPAPCVQSRPKAWKNSGNNFFPSWSSHLEQDEVVEAVLEERLRSKKRNGGSQLLTSKTKA